jgi:DNA-binding protein
MTTRKHKKEAAGKEKQPRTAPAAQASKPTESGQISENVVFIGQKPVMNYVMVCMTHFNQPDAKKVVVKARGRAICRAVDTIEVLRRAFVKDLQLEGIAIYTEEVTREQGRKSNVSAIKLTLTKP